VHLTDFASQSAPKIATCSAADMVAVSANDIITKLRFFLYIIVILFGTMHLLAQIAAMARPPRGCWSWAREPLLPLAARPRAHQRRRRLALSRLGVALSCAGRPRRPTPRLAAPDT